MQVMVFISKTAPGAEPATADAPALLVLPDSPRATIPAHLRGLDWTYFATTTPQDKLIGRHAHRIEADLAESGYALIAPTH